MKSFFPTVDGFSFFRKCCRTVTSEIWDPMWWIYGGFRWNRPDLGRYWYTTCRLRRIQKHVAKKYDRCGHSFMIITTHTIWLDMDSGTIILDQGHTTPNAKRQSWTTHTHRRATRLLNYTMGTNHSAVYPIGFHWMNHDDKDQLRRLHAILYGPCPHGGSSFLVTQFSLSHDNLKYHGIAYETSSICLFYLCIIQNPPWASVYVYNLRCCGSTGAILLPSEIGSLFDVATVRWKRRGR